MTIDLTGITTTVIAGIFGVLSISLPLIIQSRMKDQQAAKVLGDAVKNSLGAVQQAAQGALVPGVLRLKLPGVSAPDLDALTGNQAVADGRRAAHLPGPRTPLRPIQPLAQVGPVLFPVIVERACPPAGLPGGDDRHGQRLRGGLFPGRPLRAVAIGDDGHGGRVGAEAGGCRVRGERSENCVSETCQKCLPVHAMFRR